MKKKRMLIAGLSLLLACCLTALAIFFPNIVRAADPSADNTPSIPTLTVHPNTDADLGDEVTYSLKQVVGYLTDDPVSNPVPESNLPITEKYQEFTISFMLPDGPFTEADVLAALADDDKHQVWQEVKVPESRGNRVTSGTWAYDKATHIVTYTFDPDYLDSDMLYQGEPYAFDLIIKCSANRDDYAGFETATNPNRYQIDVSGKTSITSVGASSSVDKQTVAPTTFFVKTPDAALSISKSLVSPSTQFINLGTSTGVKASYEVTVSQTVENAIAQNVTVFDAISDGIVSASEGVAIDSTSVSIVDESSSPVVPVSSTINSKDFEINIGNLTYGKEITISYDVYLSLPKTDPNYDANEIKALLGNEISNSAYVKADNVSATEPVNTKFSIISPSLINTSMEPESGYMNLGETMTYTISAKVGESEDSNPIVYGLSFDNIAFATPISGIEIVSDSFEIKIGDGSYSPIAATQSEGKFSVAIDPDNTLGIAEGTEVSLRYKVAAGTKTSKELLGATFTMGGSLNADNLKSTVPVSASTPVIVSTPSLSVSKTCDAGQYISIGAGSGVNATYTITVSQTVENAIAYDVKILDTLNDTLAAETGVSIDASSFVLKKNGVEQVIDDKTVESKQFSVSAGNLGYGEEYTLSYNVVYSVPTSNPAYSVPAIKALLGKTVMNSAYATSSNAADSAHISTNVVISDSQFGDTSLVPSQQKVNPGDSISFTLSTVIKEDSTQNPVIYGAAMKELKLVGAPDGVSIDPSSFSLMIGENGLYQSATVNGDATNGYSLSIDPNNDGIAAGTPISIKFDVQCATAGAALYGQSFSASGKLDADNAIEAKTFSSSAIPVSFRVPGLSVDKSASNSKPSAGDSVVYTIIVEQTGEADSIASSVTLVDAFDEAPVPSDVSAYKNVCINGAPASESQFNISPDGSSLTVTLGDMKAGVSNTITYSVDYGTSKSYALNGKTFSNKAAATSDNVENPAYDNASVTVQSPDIAISLESAKSSLAAGDSDMLTATIKQQGTGVAKNIAAVIDLEDANSHIAVDESSISVSPESLSSKVTCTPAGSKLTIAVSSLEANETVSIAFNEDFGTDSDVSLNNQEFTFNANLGADNVDGSKKATTSVLVKSPAFEISGESSVSFINVGDTYDCEMSYKQTVSGTSAKNPVLSGALDEKSVERGISILPETIKVSLNGIEVDENDYIVSSSSEQGGAFNIKPSGKDSSIYQLKLDDIVSISYTVSTGDETNDRARGIIIENDAYATAGNTSNIDSIEEAVEVEVAAAKLILTKAAGGSYVKIGSDISYNLTVKNAATEYTQSLAKNFTINDNLDSDAAKLGYKFEKDTLSIMFFEDGEVKDITDQCTVSWNGETGFSAEVPVSLKPMDGDAIDSSTMVYVDESTKTYHTSLSCSEIDQDNEVAMTLAKAVQKGCTPCTKCKHDVADDEDVNKIVVYYRCSAADIASTTGATTLYNTATAVASNSKIVDADATVTLKKADPSPDDPQNGNGNANQNTQPANGNASGTGGTTSNSSTSTSSMGTTGDIVLHVGAFTLIVLGTVAICAFIVRKRRR